MSHSSSGWHGASISSVIPRPIVGPRKQSRSDITILIIHTSLSPNFYSPEDWRRAPEIYRLFTPWKRWSKGGGISTTGGSATITDSVINSNKVNSSGTALGGG